MRKILTISCGQAGNSIAIDYWKQLSEEAKIKYQKGYGEAQDPDIPYIPYYYNERNEQYIPNTIFIDTDPTVLDELQQGEMGRFFSQDSYVTELLPSQGVFQNPKQQGNDNKLQACIEEAIRKKAEEVDAIQGIQLIMGSAGGAGSGIGAYLSKELGRQFGYNKEIFAHILLPTYLNCRSPLDLYNTALLLPELEWNLSFIYDNQALQSTCFNVFYDQAPDYNSLNFLFSQAILGTTQFLRYPGQVNNSLAKMSHSLIPLYRLNFLTVNKAPLVGTCDDVNKLCSQLFNEKQLFCTFDPKDGKCVTCQLLLKGNISLPEIDSVIYNIVQKDSFVDWLPDNIQKTLCSESGELSGVLINNSTAIGVMFKKLLTEIQLIYENKSYFHIYQNMGIEEDQMTKSISALKDICSKYEEFN